MKKLILSSAALLLFSVSIIIFQISCKKDAMAQSGTSDCSDIATVIITVNFPGDFNPISTDDNENGLELTNIHINPVAYPSWMCVYSFRNVGSGKKKVYTFKSNIMGPYGWFATVRKEPFPGIYLSTLGTLNLSAGQTYNVTINATDFH